MGERDGRIAALARRIAVAFCAHHPTRSDVEIETKRFIRFLKQGRLETTKPNQEGMT